jgi:hypothetical protein
MLALLLLLFASSLATTVVGGEECAIDRWDSRGRSNDG